MLELSEKQRLALWQQLSEILERYRGRVDHLAVAPVMDPKAVRDFLSPVNFDQPTSPQEAMAFVEEGLTKFQMQVPHPGYMGLFNPNVSTMGIAGDTLAAAFNSQLAVWSHSPFGVEVEQLLLGEIAGKMGFDPDQAEGCFTSGGMEANHTALITALYHHFPQAKSRGLASLEKKPVLLVSEEGHHSILKAARVSGLGDDCLRLIPLAENGRMDPAGLEQGFLDCETNSEIPFLVVATAGTTNAGMVDDLDAIASICQKHQVWLHVDGAWGCAAALVPELKPILKGLERADSLTFDAHKFLSVPMGAGIFLTRHSGVLRQVFSTEAAYMPKDAEGLPVVEYFNQSLQWSRRFMGLKLFLTLKTCGWLGYEQVIRKQTEIGDLARKMLTEDGWQVINDTPLPTLCFQGKHKKLQDLDVLKKICKKVVAKGRVWISTTLFAGQPVLRLTITNYRTEESHLEHLLEDLAEARSAVNSELV